ncbi:hypothetical protein Taro_003516 [Colocasia esculenta]|uniref:Uncharacterized protein n=1 Tax=Colocasia esculenta TaxID=4460 RepID=A0A843TP10_COLES|nr:hypothetical protein [Colocasia esculenta]
MSPSVWGDLPLTDGDLKDGVTIGWGSQPMHYTGKSFKDAIASVLVGVNLHDWQIMCEKCNTSDEQERMIQLSATSLDSESGSTPISA